MSKLALRLDYKQACEEQDAERLEHIQGSVHKSQGEQRGNSFAVQQVLVRQAQQHHNSLTHGRHQGYKLMLGNLLGEGFHCLQDLEPCLLTQKIRKFQPLRLHRLSLIHI